MDKKQQVLDAVAKMDKPEMPEVSMDIIAQKRSECVKRLQQVNGTLREYQKAFNKLQQDGLKLEGAIEWFDSVLKPSKPE